MAILSSLSFLCAIICSLCMYLFADEMESEDAEKVLEKLEKIDGETDNMDVTFVKMADPRYARKWGVTKLPAIVFFRNRFPSIYRGEFFQSL